MKELSKILSDIRVGERVIYRGHANADWKLIPSIGRHFSGHWDKVSKIETDALENFKKKSIPFLKYSPKLDIEWLCLMQHHGCATRLLDFTTNPLIAIFFATDPTIESDGEFIIADYGRSYESVSNDNLFQRKNNFAYFPPHITERIIGQFGCFVYSCAPPNPISDKQLYRIRINKDRKYIIRTELKTIGISQSTLFPGLDGICKDINDSLVVELMLSELF